MLLLLLIYFVLRALWKIYVYLISTLVNKSLYYYYYYYYYIIIIIIIIILTGIQTKRTSIALNQDSFQQICILDTSIILHDKLQLYFKLKQYKTLAFVKSSLPSVPFVNHKQLLKRVCWTYVY